MVAVHQLDEISQAIGELKGSVKSIETYVHDGRHGVNNLAQKVDALGTRITRDIATLEAKIQVRIDAMDERIMALEKSSQRQAGATIFGLALLQSPLVGWVVAIGALLVAWWRGLIPR